MLAGRARDPPAARCRVFGRPPSAPRRGALGSAVCARVGGGGLLRCVVAALRCSFGFGFGGAT
eukprot:scaffold1265_cov366-Prasinococcus_capsulatus_cf.AAC.5